MSKSKRSPWFPQWHVTSCLRVYLGRDRTIDDKHRALSIWTNLRGTLSTSQWDSRRDGQAGTLVYLICAEIDRRFEYIIHSETLIHLETQSRPEQLFMGRGVFKYAVEEFSRGKTCDVFWTVQKNLQ